MGRENLSSGDWEHHKRRRACASAQTDQCLCFLRCGKYISKLNTSEPLIFQLVSVAEQAGLDFALSETPKTGFLARLT